MIIRTLIGQLSDQLHLFRRLSSAQAAQAVYDTIAVLYASRVSPQDMLGATPKSKLLSYKLHDIGLIYNAYKTYLSEHDLLDRNSYLRLLPDVIEGSKKITSSSVVILGFQSFTGSVAECVRSCMKAAPFVTGIFVGGNSDFYTNEAVASFCGIAQEFGGSRLQAVHSEGNSAAEVIRQNLFRPECFATCPPDPTDAVRVFEATDEEQEMEHIAVSIKKLVAEEGERYRKISVMLPSTQNGCPTLERVFAQYRIPYYFDKRFALSAHPVATFTQNYLLCLVDGCTQVSVDAVVSSPLFPSTQQQKDNFRNYLLHLAGGRGGVKREVDQGACQAFGFEYAAVCAVQKQFLSGLSCLPKQATGKGYLAAISSLYDRFAIKQTVENVVNEFKDSVPTRAAFWGKAYASMLDVLTEAASLTGEKPMPTAEYAKILKSGIAACDISLIPPKSDAVFVGDIATTVNTGTDVVFATGLTSAVPSAGADTALITDREIDALEELAVKISPKIKQVNARLRENIALNLCAFRKKLVLSYPLRSGGEEQEKSEIIPYIRYMFRSSDEQLLPVQTLSVALADRSYAAYCCSEVLPAAKYMVRATRPEEYSAVYRLLEQHGHIAEANAAIGNSFAHTTVANAKALFLRGTLSPTTLEDFFACPYSNFLKRGLQLQERKERALESSDAGNFIHAVLQTVAPEFNTIENDAALAAKVKDIAGALLTKPDYRAITQSKSGEEMAEAIVQESVAVSLYAYHQVKGSRFHVSKTETVCRLKLSPEVTVAGRIDRVDESEDMVRVIDYKTGSYDKTPNTYYMGIKLQLPLYLSAESTHKRAAGAYYFPAKIEYHAVDEDGNLKLQGFTDGSDDVVQSLDVALQPKQDSALVDLTMGKMSKGAMQSQTFTPFLSYAQKIAKSGAEEMLQGYVVATPTHKACEYCKFNGSCGFRIGKDGEDRKVPRLTHEDIAQISKEADHE